MADGTIFKDAVVVTTVKAVQGHSGRLHYVLDLPFQIYGQDVVQNGQIVTYSLEKLEGQEVMAKVDYNTEDESAVLNFAGRLSSFKTDSNFAKHYPSKDAFCESLVMKDAGLVVKEPIVAEEPK